MGGDVDVWARLHDLGMDRPLVVAAAVAMELRAVEIDEHEVAMIMDL